jgi:hypothetical protein
MATLRIVSLLLFVCWLQPPAARAVDSVSGVLDESFPTWNRPLTDDGFRNLGCGLIITDSPYDGMRYAVFEIQVTQPEDLALAVGEDGTTLEDTIFYLYCDPFDPLQPADNLIATSDDVQSTLLSAFTADDDITLTPGFRYFLVLTTFEPGDFGSFELEITSPTAVFVPEPGATTSGFALLVTLALLRRR